MNFGNIIQKVNTHLLSRGTIREDHFSLLSIDKLLNLHTSDFECGYFIPIAATCPRAAEVVSRVSLVNSDRPYIVHGPSPNKQFWFW